MSSVLGCDRIDALRLSQISAHVVPFHECGRRWLHRGKHKCLVKGCDHRWKAK